jgi:dehydrogenase/reductase SDR family protein 7B
MPQKSMDSNTAKGIPVEVFAKKAVKQIAKGKAEIAIAGGIESLGLYMKRFWPSLLRKLTAGRKEA